MLIDIKCNHMSLILLISAKFTNTENYKKLDIKFNCHFQWRWS